MSINLAKLLIREGIVSAAQVKESLQSGVNSGYGITESLVALGYATESQIVGFLSREYGVPSMDIDACEVDEAVLGLIPGETAFEKFLVPIGLEGTDLTIAVSDPSNILMLDDLGFITGKNIKPVIASERSIREKLAEFYGSRDSAVSSPDEGAPDDPALSGWPAEDSLSSSVVRAPVGDIIGDLECFERELSSPDTVSDGEAHTGASVEDSGQPVRTGGKTIAEQANPDDSVFDLSEEKTLQGVSPSPAKDDQDSAGPEAMETGGVDLPGIAEKPALSPEPSSGGYVIDEGEEEKVQAGPRMGNPESRAPESVTDGTGRTVLIVEVSPTVRKIMTMTLERAGYRVQAVSDGMQALARINEEIPDLVFVDIRLPHMDGYQLCKVIKSHGLTKSVPVILVSGKTGVLGKMKVRMSGASDLVTKPFSPGVLVEAAGKHSVRA